MIAAHGSGSSRMWTLGRSRPARPPHARMRRPRRRAIRGQPTPGTRRRSEGGRAQCQEPHRVDALVVVTPIARHADVLEEALKLDVPVFVEKPLTDDLGRCGPLCALAPGASVRDGQVAGSPGDPQALAECREAGKLGRGPACGRSASSPTTARGGRDLGARAARSRDRPRGARRGAAPGGGGRSLWTGSGSYAARAARSGSGLARREISERPAVSSAASSSTATTGLAVLGGGWDEHVLVHRRMARASIEAHGELPLLAELRAFVEHVAGGQRHRSRAPHGGAAAVHAIVGLRDLAR